MADQEYTQALQSVKHLTKLFNDMRTVGKALEGVQELKNIESEARDRMNEAIRDRDAARIQKAAAVADLEEANALVTAAKTKAARTVKEANQQADDIKANAQDAADDLLEKARAREAEIDQEVERKFRRYEADVEAMDAKKAELQSELDQLQGALDEMKERFS